jgi:predicted small metal-binding protein
MKEFSCGDVVPGCKAKFRARSDDELLTQVARHAREDHGIVEISADLVNAVKRNIRVTADA